MAPSRPNQGPQRVGQVIYLKSEHIEEYKKIHAAAWPEVLEQIKNSNIEDYSIFIMTEPRPTLFSSFKYVGKDWDGDMKRMAANPQVQAWWEVTDAMQESLVPGATGSATGAWWTELEEVFRLP